MGVLFCRDDETRFVPAGRCLVGRSRSCDLRLTDRSVSGEHAVLRFHELDWQVRCLGSRNGTTVNGDTVPTGEWMVVPPNAVLRFGTSAAWVLDDAGRPGALAMPRDGGVPIAADEGILVLPHADDPQALVFQTGDGRWLLEKDARTKSIEDGAAIALGSDVWTARLPSVHPDTVSRFDGPPSLLEATLHFAVSSDEEYVELRVDVGGRDYDLGARAHHYLLLTLARLRASDIDDGIVPTSAGWVYQDDLAKKLGVDDPKVYMDVFRARKQFASTGLEGAAGVVERRPGTRQMRLGVAKSHIVRL